MILITCGCGKSIAAKEEWAGIGIRCAGCGRSHTLNVPASAPAPAVVAAEPDSKACPSCAARIKVEAIKCRHCGRFLDEPAAVAIPAPPPAVPQVDQGGVLVLVVGILSWMVFCCLTSPIAWIMGASYESNCRARGVAPSGAGTVGKVLGIIGTVILLLSLGGFLLFIMAAVAASA